MLTSQFEDQLVATLVYDACLKQEKKERNLAIQCEHVLSCYTMYVDYQSTPGPRSLQRHLEDIVALVEGCTVALGPFVLSQIYKALEECQGKSKQHPFMVGAIMGCNLFHEFSDT